MKLAFVGDELVEFLPACALGERWFRVHGQRPGAIAEINGSPAGFAEAIEYAASLLLRADYPLIYGLSRSASPGQRAAVALAEWLAINHHHQGIGVSLADQVQRIAQVQAGNRAPRTLQLGGRATKIGQGGDGALVSQMHLAASHAEHESRRMAGRQVSCRSVGFAKHPFDALTIVVAIAIRQLGQEDEHGRPFALFVKVLRRGRRPTRQQRSEIFLGFFVAAEFALVKVRASQLQPMAKTGGWRVRPSWPGHLGTWLPVSICTSASGMRSRPASR